MRCLVCVCFALVVATSCTTYTTLTPPPPGRVAALDSSDNVLRVSQGVGFAFECVTGGGNPCAEGQASVDDPKIATVHPAHLTRVDRYRDGSFRPTSYVVVGVNPGQTVLRIPRRGSIARDRRSLTPLDVETSGWRGARGPELAASCAA